MVKLRRKASRNTDTEIPNQEYEVIKKVSTPKPSKTCDRCGRPISNVVKVRGENGKVYNVGTDCSHIINAE